MKLSAEYLAGFFDGEGSIIISKRHIKLRNGGKSPWYVLVVCLVNTHRPLLNAARVAFEPGKKRIYSGHGATKKPAGKNKRPCYMWHIASDQAEAFLKYIQPHLIVKRKEAELAFKFRAHVRKYKSVHMKFGVRRNEWLESDLYKKIQSEREKMYLQMRALKRQNF